MKPVQQTLDGAAAAPNSPFGSSEEPTSPWQQPEHVESRIVFTADAIETWAATQAPKQKEPLSPGPLDQRDFFGRPKPSPPLLVTPTAPLEELVATGAVIATPRSVAWADEVQFRERLLSCYPVHPVHPVHPVCPGPTG